MLNELKNKTIEINSIENTSFQKILQEKYTDFKKIIIVDENTFEYCFEYLLTTFSDELCTAEIITLPAGEENKCMEICMQVFETLTEYKIKRNDVIINLGGGVITDLGGFVATLYKRGIDFINIPTTLLAMVDASIGGKTGVDLGSFKNQIGVFSEAKQVYIDPIFLNTLPDEEIKNGFAEIIKHALISDKVLWQTLKEISLDVNSVTLELLHQSISVKDQIVFQDPLEKNVRKKLNFGHTIAHAFEGYFLKSESILPHGQAVAIGCWLESFISFSKGLLKKESFLEIEHLILSNYDLPKIPPSIVDDLYQLMLNDKKNTESGSVNFVGLQTIGEAIINQELTFEDFEQTMNYYFEKNL